MQLQWINFALASDSGVPTGPLMAEDRSDWEDNGSSSSRAAVECLQQESQRAHEHLFDCLS